LLFMLTTAFWPGFTLASDAGNSAVILTVDGPIGPATADYLSRGIETAAEERRELVIIKMDTPGGLDTAMRDIIQAILASPVPVATWVSPQGARAASAGTYILYASHIAAMAPATNLGAATPVQIGGGGGSAPGENKDDKPASEESLATESAPDSAPESAMKRKIVNDAVAYIRGLAEMRGRNADWAERAVREAVSLPAEAALEENVIDVVAADLADLLAAIDGREIETVASVVVLQTDGMTIERREPDWRTNFLSIITNPTVAYILMLVGIYGLIFEGYNPGAIVPGVVGAICLLLALYAFQVLPVNYAGLALIALGVILMAAEAFAPSFGALGIGGVIAFIVGSVILMDTDIPGFGIPLSVIVVISSIGALAVFAIIGFAVRAQRTRIVTGREEMIGLTGTALKDFEGRGSVFVHGERWFAHANVPIMKGQDVRVTDIKGLVLHVAPLESTSPTYSKEQAS
ncbi:MAG TPA: nodulation protein NfeD, partial [Gammaproteobacteria bacterium]